MKESWLESRLFLFRSAKVQEEDFFIETEKGDLGSVVAA